MADYWVWWLAAALLVGFELASGTFYLLAVGVAFVFGGLAAWLGASLQAQLLVGGGVAIVAVVIAHYWRKRSGPPAPILPLEYGQSVRVDRWNPDGTARVIYRGTQWDAELAAPDTYRAQTMYIVATRGSTLVLSDRQP